MAMLTISANRQSHVDGDRSNQKRQHPSRLKRFISKVRQRIEGVFHEIQNTGRNPERLLCKTVAGLVVHLTTKLASHTLRLLLKQQYGIDMLTFRQHRIAD